MRDRRKEPSRDPPDPPGNECKRTCDAIGLEANVAGKKFVGAVASQRDGYAPARGAAEHPGRQQRQVGKGLVHQRDDGIEGVTDCHVVERDDLVSKAETSGQRLRSRRFVIARLRHRHRESGKSRSVLGNERSDERGIDAAGQEYADRHVGDQTVTHRHIEERIKSAEPFGLALGSAHAAVLIRLGPPVRDQS